jgi:hypothetical protein
LKYLNIPVPVGVPFVNRAIVDIFFVLKEIQEEIQLRNPVRRSVGR